MVFPVWAATIFILEHEICDRTIALFACHSNTNLNQTKYWTVIVIDADLYALNFIGCFYEQFLFYSYFIYLCHFLSLQCSVSICQIHSDSQSKASIITGSQILLK